MAKHLKIFKPLIVLVSILVMNFEARLTAVMRAAFAATNALNKASGRPRRQPKVASIWVAPNHRGRPFSLPIISPPLTQFY